VMKLSLFLLKNIERTLESVGLNIGSTISLARRRSLPGGSV
jgi:hypothetical protein